MNIEFHPEATSEVVEASRFYDSGQKGLGDRFLGAIDDALEAIQENPLLWKPDRCGRMKRHAEEPAAPPVGLSPHSWER